MSGRESAIAWFLITLLFVLGLISNERISTLETQVQSLQRQVQTK